MKNEKKNLKSIIKSSSQRKREQKREKKITKRRLKSLKWMIIINFKIQNTKYEIENHTTIIITPI